jgi:5-(carboxyamino)imidazole ribonucleotide synthase
MSTPLTRKPAEPAPAIAPGAWLGLLGGGQLGRMFCMSAQSLGYKVAVLDPAQESPAGSVADRHLVADYLDPAALATSSRVPTRTCPLPS